MGNGVHGAGSVIQMGLGTAANNWIWVFGKNTQGGDCIQINFEIVFSMTQFSKSGDGIILVETGGEKSW